MWARSVSSAFGCANRDPRWPRQIPNCKRHIKKLQELMGDDRVDLWATDEVHFQQHGSRCRMWIPPAIKVLFWGRYVSAMDALCFA